MLEHILKFPEYVSQGYSFGNDVKVKKKVDKILVCGMGGSGISGDILRDYASHVPVIVNKGYDVPGFVDKKTLAIVISYSGNTEETIAAYEKIKGKTKNVLVVASGGVLGGEKNVVRVPQGFPPRYSLPFLFFSMISVLNNSSIVKKDFDLDELVNNLKSVDKNYAKGVANRIFSYVPLVYAPEGYGSVAYRWQTQLNENGKIIAHSQVFPEHNHNEIEAYLPSHFRAVLLRDPDANERINKRMDIIASKLVSPEQIMLKGASKLSKMFYGIMLGDLVSYHVALEWGFDPRKQDRIDELKEKLKK